MNSATIHTSTDYDALVIGAGFGGIRVLHELGKRGISAKVFEAGSGIGGTWFWNRYPGARADIESWVYIFTFFEELGIDWNWRERFPTQPEVEEYLNCITDYLGLRQNIELNTRVTSAYWDETKNVWRLSTMKGDRYTSKFLITATGPVSTPLRPPYPGLDSFQGEWYHTGLWPNRKVDFTGKRVAVVGTGSSGVQVIPIIAENAKSLTVFQRTPSYVLPARNHPLIEEKQLQLKRDFKKSAQRARSQHFGMDVEDTTLKFTDLQTDVEIRRVLESGWETGGFRFIGETFADMLTNTKCNETATEFIRNKIRSIVKDQKTAELLCPHYTILSKRPALGSFYYETFNRDNVELVNVKDVPIEAVTPKGLRTRAKEYEFDVIVFAIGFDTITGTLTNIDIRGTGNQRLGEQLDNELATAYGIAVPRFPNLFMLGGPQSPLANAPLVIDNTATWIGDMICFMLKHGHQRVEPKQDVARSWREKVDAAYNSTVLPADAKKHRSWYIRADPEAKTVSPYFWFGGVKAYFAFCDEETANGFPGFTLSRRSSTPNRQARL